MVEIPVVVQVLVVPAELARVGVEGEGRVVVEVLVVDAAEHELRRRRRDRRADVDEVQVGVVARDHPRADVHPLLVGHAAPGLVPRLARRGHERRAPQLRPRRRVVGDDDAGDRARARAAAPAGDHLAAGDDRPRGVARGVDAVVEDLGLPDQLARDRVERVDVVVVGGVDDQPAVDGDVAVVVREPAHDARDILGDVPAVLPEEVAGDGVDRLQVVLRVRHVEPSAVGQRRPLLGPGRQGAGPHHAQVAHVVAIDLVEGAVAPAVERAPPHQPVARRRVLEHGVGDGDERVSVRGGGLRAEREGSDRLHRQDEHRRQKGCPARRRPPAAHGGVGGDRGRHCSLQWTAPESCSRATS